METHVETNRQVVLRAGAKKRQSAFDPVDNSHKGKLCWLQIDKLHIPVEGELGYQREEIPGHASKIAAEFNWWFFQTIVVVQRKDLNNRLEVAEGGHRVRSTRLRGDISEVPAIVHPVETAAEAATIFTTINDQRRAIAFDSAHKAGVIAEDPTHLRVKEAFEAINSTAQLFKAKKALMTYCRKTADYKVLLELIPLLREIGYLPTERRSAPIGSYLFKGLMHLELAYRKECGHSLTEPRWTKKILKLGNDMLNDFSTLTVTKTHKAPQFARILQKRINVRPNPLSGDSDD
jgi:hypothetical protein